MITTRKPTSYNFHFNNYIISALVSTATNFIAHVILERATRSSIESISLVCNLLSPIHTYDKRGQLKSGPTRRNVRIRTKRGQTNSDF